MSETIQHTQRSYSVRTGVDITDVATVSEALVRFGDRYRQRVYTASEVAYCSSAIDQLAVAQRFAARFAAKEAVVKILRPIEARPEWSSIEIVRHSGGWCDVKLSGTANTMANEAGIKEISISMSHEGGLALATAVALVYPSTHQGSTP